MTPMLKRRRRKHAKESTTTAYIGLGANLGERELTLDDAVRRLDDHPGITVERVSRKRETDPVGYADQPRFVNAVASVRTDRDPRALLETLLEVERELGRVRGEGPRYGPRPIDLDLLLYGETTIEEPGLRVPHPRMHERKFVLEPLAELDPGLVIPGRGRVSDLLAKLE
jgi:2-amino-4-hydroxy-6-hydroxymethyldihydropteridine diphosphokinase